MLQRTVTCYDNIGKAPLRAKKSRRSAKPSQSQLEVSLCMGWVSSGKSIKGTKTVIPWLELRLKPELKSPAHGHGTAWWERNGECSSWLPASAQTKNARFRTTASSLSTSMPCNICSLIVGSQSFSAERRIPMLMTSEVFPIIEVTGISKFESGEQKGKKKLNQDGFRFLSYTSHYNFRTHQRCLKCFGFESMLEVWGSNSGQHLPFWLYLLWPKSHSTHLKTLILLASREPTQESARSHPYPGAHCSHCGSAMMHHALRASVWPLRAWHLPSAAGCRESTNWTKWTASVHSSRQYHHIHRFACGQSLFALTLPKVQTASRTMSIPMKTVLMYLPPLMFHPRL